MDAHHFDALTRRLTLRRSFGLLAIVGLPRLVSPDAAMARKKCPPCKKRKNGKCKKKPNGTVCATGECVGGRCITPTCFDGRKNGSETGVDCGGSCQRCSNGQGCTTRNDCASAFCSGGTCQPCVVAGSECGFNGARACTCASTSDGNVCIQDRGMTASTCELCPPGTVACSPPSMFSPAHCFDRCGTP